jgi:phytoene dehydrogenase-like protein
MFAVGDAALPEDGMGAITKQLADGLTSTQIRFNTRVDSLEGLRVRLDNNQTIESRGAVLAVDGPEASRLTNGRIRPPGFNATTCLYYAAHHPPFRDKLLMLNGDQTSPINNLCVPTNVVPGYAPEGQTLVSVSVVGSKDALSADVEAGVRRQLRDWFGSQVDQWLMLRSYNIRNALPSQPARFHDVTDSECKLADGLYRCGDYCETASIQGAMLSGRKAAEAVLRDLHNQNMLIFERPDHDAN